MHNDCTNLRNTLLQIEWITLTHWFSALPPHSNLLSCFQISRGPVPHYRPIYIQRSGRKTRQQCLFLIYTCVYIYLSMCSIQIKQQNIMIQICWFCSLVSLPQTQSINIHSRWFMFYSEILRQRNYNETYYIKTLHIYPVIMVYLQTCLQMQRKSSLCLWNLF